MQHRYSKYIDIIVFIVDALLLNISFIIAYKFSFGTAQGLFTYPYSNILLFTNITWVALSFLGKPFRISRISKLSEILRTIVRFIVVQLFSISAVLVFINQLTYSRQQLITTYVVFPILILIWRVIFIYSIRLYRKFGYNYRNVVVVGYGDISEELQKFFRLHPEFGFRFLGFFDNGSHNKIQGKIEDLKYFVRTNRVDEIYCCLPYVKYSAIQNIISFGEKNFIKVKLIADFRGFQNKGLEIESYDSIPILNVTSFPLEFQKNRIVKRAFDILFSLIVIIGVFSWLFPIIAIAIKLDSRGDVFFKQIRSGKSNNDFWCWKFRTMRKNKNADTKQATLGDERVTRVGAFLRKTSLDELPQFFNVLMGSMSVVGPRPHMLHHTKEYSKKVERFMARHFVKPGITGLAQAKGYRGETPDVSFMKNRVKFDRFYIENWSLFLDLKIIILTILTLVRGDENAY
ncbi:undecaprenyl-phosphate glucose phosphotransferase [Fulvivirga lutea]|uniref:Undecaprenyl-phosphate glucose phosphotransferase n=1 Tax=Fulvivirga lutea TaxID=2810512 RepID=A0A975A213_9BACT|nr:undecaprenyl-phosphate glucose phosphotransferase [Fulvivirga lutea]QSE98396.1 undecaprenyl-phosphate glucose phosphotransferase [Fulvivirga lutea]